MLLAPAVGIGSSGDAPVRLFIGVVGIYGSFLLYGWLWEDLMFYQPKWTWVWMMNVFEAIVNLIFSGICCCIFEGGPRRAVPQIPYAVSGALQVGAKGFTGASMLHGVSFPVSMLVKSSKMVPVMIGQIIIGKARYNFREYLHVLLICIGTALVCSSKDAKVSGSSSSALGLLYLAGALFCDGTVAGTLKALKGQLKERELKEHNFEMQFYSNFYMLLTATFLMLVFEDVDGGINFLIDHPDFRGKILTWTCCSAVGTGFIFFTISSFDPLVSTTITTTRKIFSVLLSVFLQGHTLLWYGWGGIIVACTGIGAELQEKYSKRQSRRSSVTDADVEGSFERLTTGLLLDGAERKC